MVEATEKDRELFLENGYAVVKGAVPPELCARVVDVLWSFAGKDRDDPATWYQPDPRMGGMLELYHDQALWDVRQHPALHAAFARLLATERLWVSIDRISMKPPLTADHPSYDDNGFVHLDFDPRDGEGPAPWTVQGVVNLTDTDPDQGSFWCVPEIYRNLEAWVADQPPEIGSWGYTNDFTPTSVGGRAGDVIVWSTRMPHGSGPNRSRRPRLAQYVTMFPALEHDQAARTSQVRAWREKLIPVWGTEAEKREPGGPAHLTGLGRKLVGLDSW